MKLIKIDNVNGNDFIFVCTADNTRHGFKHTASMFVNGTRYPVNAATCYYYNRTWEKYAFQSACIAAVNNAINDRVNRIKEEYKENNNIKRVTKKHAPALEKKYKEDVLYSAYNDVKTALYNNCY